jgi:hypothetical protein
MKPYLLSQKVTLEQPTHYKSNSLYVYEHIKKTAGVPRVIHVAKRFLLFHKWIPFLSPPGSSAQKAQFALDNFSRILPRFSGGDV